MRQKPQPWQPLERGHNVVSPEKLKALLKMYGEQAFQTVEGTLNQEVWLNHKYVVLVERRDDGSVEELSIRRQDRKPMRDWRDLQRIKNEIAGWETEAVELYPAMSRIMDTANQSYLWCLPPGKRFEFGYDAGVNLRDSDEAREIGAQQRALPDDWKELRT